MGRLITLIAAAAVTLDVAAWAQRAGPQSASKSTTGNIRGRITTADTGAPIRAAEVRLSSAGQSSRLVATNGDGRFDLRDVQPGTYTLTVSRTGFVSLKFGQHRPFEPATTIHLAAGQSLTADVSLIRGGAIYGRLLDQFGEPAAGTRLQAFRSRMVEGGRRLQSVGASDLADDNGAFRLYGLPPGNYVVMASPGAPGFNAFKRDPPIYYPGTPNLAEAQPVALGIGAEAAVDFNLVSTRYARVSGLVLNASGAPAAAARINLRQDAFGLGPDFAGGVAPILHAEGAPDGTFTVENVPPGNYTLSAVSFVELASPDRRAAITSPDGLSIVTSRVPESATMPIVVSGDDLSGLTLAVRPGSMLIGRFETDTGVARPLPSGLQVSARAPNAGGNTTSILSFTRGEFRITTMAEPVRIQVAGLPDDWAVKAILVDGADVTDDTIELKDPTVDVRIVLTDRVTSISGRVEARQKTGGHRILVFADDAARWKWPSRYVRTTMADDEGRFLIRGLPPGERYNIAALEYFEEGDEQDPEFLHRLRRFATSVSLREGEQQTVQLKVAAR